jgi:hypothetical protein
VDELGLLPGRIYRLQVIVHEGDTDKGKAQVGHACGLMAYGLTDPPCRTDLHLEIVRSVEGLRIGWRPANAVLQEADTPGGPWRDVGQGPSVGVATNGLLQLLVPVPPAAPAKFYRVRLP